MRSFFAFALASLPLAFAQNVINVTVGANGQLRYDPESVTAQLYDYVVFTFSPKNHTVTQSSFNQPCTPLLDGVNSGFRPVSNATTTQEAQQFQFQVLDLNPKWFFCQQTNPVSHCASGMVFAVNPGPDGSNNSFAAFQALANSSSTSTTATAPSSTYSTPPPQSWTTTTAAITSGTSTWTSTYTSYVGSPAPTYAAAGPQTWVVNVGPNGTLTYDPPFVSAALGDVVVFTFHAKNHTATQSTFSAPCQPRLDTAGQQGFDSGFMAVTQDATSFPTFNVTVNDTAPTWVYCRQTNHCGSGMVFAINAVNDGPNNFTAFQSLAEHINGTTSSGAAASASSSQTGASPTNGSGNGSAGIPNARVHGAALVLSLVAAAAYLL